MSNSNASHFKSLGIFVLILIASLAVVLFTMNQGSTDVRSRAANQAENVVDSDALLDASEQSLNDSKNDSDLNSTADEDTDDAELQELNGL